MAGRKLSATLMMLLVTDPAAAATSSILTLGQWDNSVQGTYNYERDRARSPGSPDNNTSLHSEEYQLSINNRGFFILDPALVTGSVGITLGTSDLSQRTNGLAGTTTATASHTSSKTNLTGYTFDAEFLNQLPYGGSLYFNRASTATVQPFGYQKTTTSNRGIVLRLSEDSALRDMGLPYLSANLRLEQQHINEYSTTSQNQSYQYDQHLNTVALEGHKGWQHADLYLLFKHGDTKQPQVVDGNYTTQNSTVNYSRDFGPRYDRRWDSRVNYVDRTGAAGLSMLTVNEELHIDHKSNLSTDYNYQLMRTKYRGVPNNSYSMTASALYQPYQNLNTSWSAMHQSLETGPKDSVTGLLNFQHDLPANGKLYLGLGGSEQLTRTQVSPTAYVYYEPHNAPSLLGGGAYFQLNQGPVDTTSILVWDTRIGHVPAQLGVDYTIDQVGSETRIVPNPNSLIIQAGDPLEVSYTYQVPPNLKYNTAANSFTALADFRWIAFTLSHDESDNTVLSGSDNNNLLQDSRHDKSQIDLRGHWNRVDASAGASYLAADETLVAYRQRHFYQNATFRYSPNLMFMFNADQLLTDYSLPVRQTQTHSIMAAANWYPPIPGLTVNAQLRRRSTTDSTSPTQTVSEGDLKAKLQYGKLTVTSSFTVDKRTYGDSELYNWLFNLMVMRKL